ncbi:MAG: ABC transporter substrate binding protein [Methylotenera sp.]|nr:ABC transporter substrate binding protein [Methylotenera sp.]
MTAPTQTNLEFVDQFKIELAESKHNKLRVKVITLPVAEKLVVAENSELVIALGVKALEVSSKLKHTTPVIGVFTPLPAFNSLLLKSRRELSNFSAIVLDQPYARQLSLIKKILPEAKTLGILIGATSSAYGKLLKEEAEKSGFRILEESVNQEAELIPKLKKLLEATDALLAMPDPLIYNRETAQPILLTSYRYKKPIFGYSQSYVRAGGLAAVYSSSKQLAKQAAEIAIKSQQAPSELPPPQAPKYFSIMLNYQVARSLNIPLQDEETIYKKMLKSEAKEANGE